MSFLLSIIYGQTLPFVTYITTSGVRKYSVETKTITAFKKKVSRLSRNA